MKNGFCQRPVILCHKAKAGRDFMQQSETALPCWPKAAPN
jgi:hypothetical protein